MLKLLIVDDEKNTRETLKDYISWHELGITKVETAKNGLDALGILQNFIPNILLTDVRMPKMDGIELATKIRENYPECKIIFLSGYSDKEYLMSAIKLRAFGYIEKPINRQEVITIITDAVSLYYEEQKIRSDERNRIHSLVDSLSAPNNERDMIKIKINDIIKYINEHYSENDISVKAIADHAYMSTSYLCVFFKKYTNKTLNDYLTEVRIENAKLLLKDNRKKLYEIATSVGFTDANYFSTLFKKITGMTPSEYKERGC